MLSAGLISRLAGTRGTVIVVLFASGAGSAVLAIWHASTWEAALGMFGLGVGSLLTMAGRPKLITDAVPLTHTGVATWLNMVMRTVGGVLDAQIAALLVAAARRRC